MANFRYLILLILVVAAAAVAVLWQEDDTPTITFTRPADLENEEPDKVVPNDESLSTQNDLDKPSIVPLTEPLTAAPSNNVPLLSDDQRDKPTEDDLSEQQLAEQIKLAQEKLAQVEALNARKQAQVNQALAQESSAEQPLIEAELAYQIGGWRQAWRIGDAHTYFSFYSAKFKPSNGKTMDEWKAQRVKRLNPEQPIDLDLEDFDVTFDPVTQRSLVTFKQHYRSGNYKDTSNKRLIMANEQGQWKIISETTRD